MSKLPADQALAADLAAAKISLDQTFDGRWHWFWRNRKAARHLRQLGHTTPALIGDYRSGQRAFRTALAQVQKEPRRQVRQLRWQLVFASIAAVLRRFGGTILTFLAFAAVAAALWFSLPFLIALLEPSEASTYITEPFGEGPR